MIQDLTLRFVTVTHGAHLSVAKPDLPVRAIGCGKASSDFAGGARRPPHSRCAVLTRMEGVGMEAWTALENFQAGAVWMIPYCARHHPLHFKEQRVPGTFRSCALRSTPLYRSGWSG
jgi:hypothetical protein